MELKRQVLAVIRIASQPTSENSAPAEPAAAGAAIEKRPVNSLSRSS